MIPHSSIITALSTGGLFYLLFLHILASYRVDSKYYIPILVGSSLLHNSFVLPMLLLIQLNHERSIRDQIFADGADKNGMMEMYRNPRIDGFTTNPTLMRKAGSRTMLPSQKRS